jgi:hypothetical protein
MADMPGSESMKIHAMQREGSSWLVRGAVAIGAVAAVVTVVAATHDYGKPPTLDVGRESTLPAGIRPADGQYMLRLEGWRLAHPDDFTGAAAGWMRGNGQPFDGRLEGDFTGEGGGDSAYLLVNDATGKRRIVIVGHGSSYYDVEFNSIAGFGRLPQRYTDGVEWSAPIAGGSDGDGLVLVFDGNDPHSAIVLFLQDKRIVSGKPADYQRTRLN